MKSEKVFENEASGHGRAQDKLLKRVASEIMELYATSSPTKKDLECLLGRRMQQAADFPLSDQRFPAVKKRKLENKTNKTTLKDLQLQILDKIGIPVFTKEPIKGENCTSLKVALVDAHSGEVVTYGPEASARVRVVILKAGIDANRWTPEEFKSMIVAKEGKGQLFSGDVSLNLNEGIGFIGLIHFHQTSIWKTKCEYRLGVMVEDDSIKTRIREGISESFYVKDRRLLLDNKDNPPKLFFEVWRLKGIARGGPFHKRLNDFNINTVEEFLKELNTDPQKLRDIIGKRMSSKSWKHLVGHARTCIPFQEPTNQKVVQAYNMDGVGFTKQGEGFVSDNDTTELTASLRLRIDGSDHQQAKTCSPDIVSSLGVPEDTFSLDDLFHDANMNFDFTSGYEFE